MSRVTPHRYGALRTTPLRTEAHMTALLTRLLDAPADGLRDGIILEARDLTKAYPLGATTVEALRGVSLTVEAGEFVALMGPSGSGKSTLLQLLGGLDRPTSGEVILAGETISELSDDRATRLRRDRTGFVFQSFNLIPLLDVTENVALPFTIAGQDPSRGELAERIRDVIASVELTGKEHHKPDQLSAGEQQRVAVARALVTRPALLLADEPTGNLDYTTGTEILDALWRSCQERHQTIVLVTHDSKAAAYADRVLVVGDGRIRDTIELGRRADHDATALITRLAQLGL
ncbi:MAG TPA: ABC transporter ATP-binding protein [Candidatus Limnocylindrales bacterium]|jgi:putative ABC transport system ATP-binding protein|nr:ABC transporter ATP-binding protein [Candidatus Limnocylindrales bacterium]